MSQTILRLLTASILSVSLSGAGAADNPENSYFAARRQAVMKRIEGAVAVLAGAEETRAYTKFRQNNDFYYLTGVETPGAFLLLDGAEGRSILFLPPRDPHNELWEGPRLIAGEEARIVTGMDAVSDFSAFESELQKRAGKELYIPLAPEEPAFTSRDRAARFDSVQASNPWDGRPSRATAFAQNLAKRLGDSVQIRDLSPILDDMRRVKDAMEIQRLRESARIGASGLNAAMRSASPGRHEYQIAAVAEFLFQWNGASGPAYSPIVGSGPNSCILHYNANTRRMEPGDIVVMDFGPEYRYYQSDITRTFPVTGKFTEEQARVYQIVLDAQKAALDKVRPGSTVQAINNAAREVLARAGYERNLLHGVSHYVGMAVHDVGGTELPLEAGVVLTVEPGIYLPERNLGVRIEDTVLVTVDGSEILSRLAPKEIVEIEKLMQQSGIEP